MIGIVELTNFQIDKATEKEIEQQLQTSGLAGYWRDQNKNNVERLYDRIWHKAQVYSALVEKLRVPCVVAVFGEFKTAVDFHEELCPCLFDERAGLFDMYLELSDVLYFEECAGRYLFDYAHNPNALRAVDLPKGVFPPQAT